MSPVYETRPATATAPRPWWKGLTTNPPASKARTSAETCARSVGGLVVWAVTIPEV
jgi:hypothetical protein